VEVPGERIVIAKAMGRAREQNRAAFNATSHYAREGSVLHTIIGLKAS
jgi:hypothetical protein